jgi:hypothetical protein
MTSPDARPPSKAVTALVLAFLFCPAGLVLGLQARKQIARDPEHRGEGLATAAIVVSSILLGVSVLGGLVASWLVL